MKTEEAPQKLVTLRDVQQLIELAEQLQTHATAVASHRGRYTAVASHRGRYTVRKELGRWAAVLVGHHIELPVAYAPTLAKLVEGLRQVSKEAKP